MKSGRLRYQIWRSPHYSNALLQCFGEIESLLSLSKFDRAAQKARQALSVEPEIAHLHFLLAYALWMQHKVDDAKASALKAVQLDAHNAPAYNLMGMMASSERKFGAAKQYHKQALDLQPFNAEYHARYGQAWFHLEDWKQAMACYDQALRLDPNCVLAHLLRAQALRQRSYLDAAEENIRAALQLQPENPLAHEILGDNFFDRQQASLAYAAYRVALRLNPQNELVKKKLIDALEAKIPLLGEFWHSAYNSRRRPVRATTGPIGTGLLTLLFGSCPVLTLVAFWRFENASMRLFMFLFSCFPLVLLLFGAGLLKQILYDFVDPLITHAVLNGWIKL